MLQVPLRATTLLRIGNMSLDDVAVYSVFCIFRSFGQWLSVPNYILFPGLRKRPDKPVAVSSQPGFDTRQESITEFSVI